MTVDLLEPRDVTRLAVAAVGAVRNVPPQGWVIVDASGEPVPEVRAFMVELLASDCSRATTRSYAYDLLRWWRFLAALEVPWQAAGREEVRDYVRWLQQLENPQRRRSGRGVACPRPPAGSVNPETSKAYLAPGYAPRTINHALTVLSGFYAFALDNGLGSLRNPVPQAVGPARSFTDDPRHWQRRAAYRQRTPQLQPRAITEELLQRVFEVLGNDRDRAMLAVTLSSGVRASELLSMTCGGADAGRSVLAIVAKGRGSTPVWVPAAPEAFIWISRYLLSRAPGSPQEPLWMTLTAPPRPLTYMTLRRVMERVNQKLGTNLTWHDLRHTFTGDLLDDEHMSVVDVQQLTRHRSLSSLVVYSQARLEQLVASLHRHLARRTDPPPSPAAAPGYDAADLKTLFPGLQL